MVVELTTLPWRCTGALLGTAVGQCERQSNHQIDVSVQYTLALQ